MTETLLTVEHLTSGYNGNDVLRDASLTIERSQICGIVGSNGAGKTTLLRTIFGAVPARQGRISFQGKDISLLSLRERIRIGLAYVPQERNVFANLTVIENLEISFAAVPRDVRLSSQLDFVFSLFPRLRERQHQLVGTMSGGEQRMVAIGIGLITKPHLLMLDEPTTGLAPQVVHQLMNAIKTMNLEHGIAAIVVEQNILSLLKIVNAVEIVRAGAVRRYQGDPQNLVNENVWEFM